MDEIEELGLRLKYVALHSFILETRGIFRPTVNWDLISVRGTNCDNEVDIVCDCRRNAYQGPNGASMMHGLL